MDASWGRVFVYTIIIYVPLILLVWFWTGSVVLAIAAFVLALLVGMALNAGLPSVVPPSPRYARKVRKVIAQKQPKNR